ncbi:fimbria/pilus outer membrane usher protein [Lonsdalea quercina]|uniref:fimbria/pilus outer membrane usher protein n=1 Tax=Lonsdalea quercina TaxID=71657 RepID=UPI003976F416
MLILCHGYWLRRHIGVIPLLVLAYGGPPAAAEEYGDLPKPPQIAPAVENTTYYLTLIVNGVSDRQVVPVQYNRGHFSVESGVLAKNYIHIGTQRSGWVDVNALPEVKVYYDAGNQSLKLTVPLEWLPEQSANSGMMVEATKAQSTPGLAFNYDAYYFKGYQSSQSVTTWLEQRLFNDYALISNTGTYSHYFGHTETDTGNKGYLRYDTFWRYNDIDDMYTFQAGDFISNSLTWSNSVRMGGVRFSRDFAVRPDIVTYPLIQYAGANPLPSTVDLFINGYKASSTSLNSGPFTLTNVPYINGAGEATVITTDALGRQVSTSVPFYVSNTLLRKGLDDFDVSLGILRRNYGVKDADYGQSAASGIYRRGLTNWLTLSSHLETSENLLLGGVGGDLAIGHWGTLSSAYSHSQDNGQGEQYVVGYSYYANTMGIAAQHAERSSRYQDLSVASSGGHLSKQSDQITFSTTPFGLGNGTLGLGYFNIRAHDDTRTRLANLSYSWSIWDRASMYFSLNKNIGSHGYGALLQMIVPLDNGISATASVQKNSMDEYTERVSMTRTTPTEGGLGWNLAYSGGDSHDRQASFTWKTQRATYQAGMYGATSAYNYWGDLSGSVLYMDDTFFAANKINDAFIVVSTEGYPDVPVKYENQQVGTTSNTGHILVPWVSAYYPARVEIDTLELPLGIDAPETERRVAVKEGSGALVKFNVRQVHSFNLNLVDDKKAPLPVGSYVTDVISGQTALVGYDGQVFMEQVTPHIQLRVQRSDSGTCVLNIDLPDNKPGIAILGEKVCTATEMRPDTAPSKDE